jgi:hypothetical protein
MLHKCIYGGGDSCSRQGGDGSLQHGVSFVHPYPSIEEAGRPVGSFVKSTQPEDETPQSIADFNIDFDEDNTSAIMSLVLSKSIDVEDLIKSLYDFDMETEEGIVKLLGLLPIMDPDIVVEMVEKIWPGYAVNQEDPALLRGEIKGYLLDYLDEGEAEVVDEEDA